MAIPVNKPYVPDSEGVYNALSRWVILEFGIPTPVMKLVIVPEQVTPLISTDAIMIKRPPFDV